MIILIKLTKKILKEIFVLSCALKKHIIPTPTKIIKMKIADIFIWVSITFSVSLTRKISLIELTHYLNSTKHDSPS